MRDCPARRREIASENVPRQVGVLGQLADPFAHIGAVDGQALAGAVGGGEADLLDHLLQHRLQPARADVLHRAVDLDRRVGQGVDGVVGEVAG